MNSSYGTKRPAYINSSDVDIFYFYRKNRSSEASGFTEFVKMQEETVNRVFMTTTVGGERLPGMYDIRLPLDIFGEAGIYTLYIKPKEISATIFDVSTLLGYPDVYGIVLSNTDSANYGNGDLVGYRVEYFDGDVRYPDDTFRIITSNNRCQPVGQSINSSSQNTSVYCYSDSGTYMFCTVSPSTSMAINKTSIPFIGNPGQKISLINTKFNPVMLEVELTTHDIESIATMLEGDQIRNLDNGIITTFNNDGEMYHQAEYGHIVNTNKSLNHDFRIKKNNNYNYSETQNLETIKDNL